MTMTKIAAGTLMALASLACGGSATANTRPVETSSAHEVAGAWERLGERSVDGAYDRDVIEVGAKDGRFTTIEVRVDGAAIEMFEIKVKFGDGEVFEPKTRLVFDKDTRSRAIDLPGNKRIIQKVEFRYGKLEKGKHAKVELWGKRAE